MSLPLTLQNAILSLKELLTAFINEILYCYNIYPQEVFKKAKSFDTIIHVSRNPLLNSYIDNLLNDFLKLLFTSKGGSPTSKVKSLMLIIYDSNKNKALDRHIITFDEMVTMDRFITVEQLNDLLSGNIEKEEKTAIEDKDFTWSEVFNQYRYFLMNLKRSLDSPQKQQIKDGKNNFFKILLDGTSSLDLTINDGLISNWVKVTNSVKESSPRSDHLSTVGEVSIGFLCFGAYNEQEDTF